MILQARPSSCHQRVPTQTRSFVTVRGGDPEGNAVEPMQRYQTAAEMQAALTGHIAAPIVGIPQTARPYRRPVLAGVLLMVIVGVVIAEAMLSGNRPVRAPVPVTQSGTKTTPAVITMGNVARSVASLFHFPSEGSRGSLRARWTDTSSS